MGSERRSQTSHLESLSIPRLIACLRSSLREDELAAVASLLLSRDRRISEKAELEEKIGEYKIKCEEFRQRIERNSREISLKEAAKLGLEAKCERLEEELEIERRESAASEEVEEYKRICEESQERISGLLEELERKSHELLSTEKAKLKLEAKFIRFEEELELHKSKCSELEEKIEQRESVVSDELKEYEKKCRESHERFSGLLEELKRKSREVLLKEAVELELEAKCEGLAEELAVHKSKCLELEEEIEQRESAVRDVLKMYKNICGESQKRVGGLLEELERKSRELLLTEAAKLELEGKCKRFEEELELHTSKCSEMEEEIERQESVVNDELKEYKNKCGESQTRISGLLEELERNVQEVSLKEAVLVELEARCKGLEEEVAMHDSKRLELEEIKRQESAVSDELKEYKNKCGASQERISGLLEELGRNARDVLVKKVAVVELEAKCEGLEEELAMHKNKCLELEEKIERWESAVNDELNEYKNKCGESQERISGLLEELEKKSRELSLKEAAKLELEAKCERLEEELVVRERKLLELEEKIKEGESGFGLSITELKQKLKELENYKNQCRRHEVLIQCMKEENRIACGSEKKAQERFVKLMWELKTKEKVVKTLFECERRSKMEVDEWRRKYEEVEARALRLVEENMMLKKKSEMIENEQGKSSANSRDENSGHCREPTRTGPSLEQKNRQSSSSARDENHKHSEEPITPLDLEGDSNRRKCPLKVETSKPLFAVVIEDDINVGVDGSIEKFADTKNEAAHKPSEELQYSQRHVDDARDNNSSSEASILVTASSKRKQSSRVVTASSEDNDDNKLPISQVVKKRLVGVVKGSSQRDNSLVNYFSALKDIGTEAYSKTNLVTQPQCVATGGMTGASSGFLVSLIRSPTGTNSMISRCNGAMYHKLESPDADVEKNEAIGRKGVDAVASENGSERLDVHSVNSSAGTQNPCNSNETSRRVSGSSQIDKMPGERDIKRWRYENDLLSNLEEDPILCMQAVCAIYRRQMSWEKSFKGTMHARHRGFSPFDAYRGTKMAAFLLDGDWHGPLKKTVQELEQYDPKGIDHCRKLATHYSNQLFMIYQNNEDPFFSC